MHNLTSYLIERSIWINPMQLVFVVAWVTTSSMCFPYPCPFERRKSEKTTQWQKSKTWIWSLFFFFWVSFHKMDMGLSMSPFTAYKPVKLGKNNLKTNCLTIALLRIRSLRKEKEPLHTPMKCMSLYCMIASSKLQKVQWSAATVPPGKVTVGWHPNAPPSIILEQSKLIESTLH